MAIPIERLGFDVHVKLGHQLNVQFDVHAIAQLDGEFHVNIRVHDQLDQYRWDDGRLAASIC